MAAQDSTSRLCVQLTGPDPTRADEVGGYCYWGLIALFIAIPELLAAFSAELKADIPWPTISNLIGKDLERRYHWVALLIVGTITAIIVHVFTRPANLKRAGRAVRQADLQRLSWTWPYILVTAAVAGLAGFAASALGGDKNQVGYAIYGMLVMFGVVIPSALAYFWHRVLSIPTLFATLAMLDMRHRGAATLAVSLLVVLTFHLALYPWPNLPFG